MPHRAVLSRTVPSPCTCCPGEWGLGGPLEDAPVLRVTEFQYCLLCPTVTNHDSCDYNVLISIPDFDIEIALDS